MTGWFEIEYLFRVVKKHVGLLFLVFRVHCGRQDCMISLYTTLTAVSETSSFQLFETRCGRDPLWSTGYMSHFYAMPAAVAETFWLQFY